MKTSSENCSTKNSKPHYQRLWRLLSQGLSYTFVSILSFYRTYLSPHFGGGCRFYPSCSAYAHEAYKTHSFFQATHLTLSRLMKCHPFGAHGVDPVPAPKELK